MGTVSTFPGHEAKHSAPIVELYLLSPIHHHDIVINELGTGTPSYLQPDEMRYNTAISEKEYNIT
jgi:hypothetical protein